MKKLITAAIMIGLSGSAYAANSEFGDLATKAESLKLVTAGSVTSEPVAIPSYFKLGPILLNMDQDKAQETCDMAMNLNQMSNSSVVLSAVCERKYIGSYNYSYSVSGSVTFISTSGVAKFEGVVFKSRQACMAVASVANQLSTSGAVLSLYCEGKYIISSGYDFTLKGVAVRIN
jgi:hypothetical protein